MLRALRTVAHLKPIQVLNRLYRATPTMTPARVRVSGLRLAQGAWVDPIRDRALTLTSKHASFINIVGPWSKRQHWNDSAKSKLWLYNLHYHDGLASAAADVSIQHQFIDAWIADNPPTEGAGWEPYPSSLRIVNWVKWLLCGGNPVKAMHSSLALQTAWLARNIEYHLLGNHLFANAKALVFGGLYFEGPYADRWLSKGLRILREQLHEQFLPDGGHFELSTTYQATLTEDLLDLINILRTYGHDHAPNLVPVAEKALSWLQVMTRPDGLPPLFNDAAYRISPTLSQLTEYAGRLGVSQLPAPTASMVQLPESGYFRYLGREYSIWCDAGQIGPDYIPGHAHCDMLSFELFAQGSPIIVDTGTSTYEVGNRRFEERSTRSHNTVQVEEFEQSEIWSAFRVARRARIKERQSSPTGLSATMQNFNGAYKHRRTFEFSASSVMVDDEVTTKRSNVATARFHFHPRVALALQHQALTVNGLRLSFEGANHVALTPYKYAPEFNKTIEAQCLEVGFDRKLKTHIQL